MMAIDGVMVRAKLVKVKQSRTYNLVVMVPSLKFSDTKKYRDLPAAEDDVHEWFERCLKVKFNSARTQMISFELVTQQTAPK